MVFIASTGTIASGTSSVTFSSIPQTFTHLQVRCFAQNYFAGGAGGQLAMRFNSDTGQNYTRHNLFGNGSLIASDGFATGTYSYISVERFYWTNTGSVFGANITDILDYTSTNKTKTVRTMGGWDSNSAGEISFASGMWTNTSAITSINIFPSGSTFNQYSRIDLYGITTSSVTGA